MMLKLTQRNRGRFETLLHVGKHLIVGNFLERSRFRIYQEDAMNLFATMLSLSAVSLVLCSQCCP